MLPHFIFLIIFLFFSISSASITRNKLEKLPGSDVPFPSDTWSGYIPIRAEGNIPAGKLFYFFTASINKELTEPPFVFWQTGGPGCSSLGIGAFTEVGPLNMTDSGKFVLDSYTMNTNAHVLYIDSPYQVGFSSTGVDITTWTSDMYATLIFQALSTFTSSPEFKSYFHGDIHIFSESYGPHLISKLARRLVPSTQFSLKTLGYGNGWMVPDLQYPSMLPFCEEFHLVNATTKPILESMTDKCMISLKGGNIAKANQDCGMLMQSVIEWNPDINPTFVTKPCPQGSCFFTQQWAHCQAFFNSTIAKKYIGADINIDYTLCNMNMGAAFSKDRLESVLEDLTFILESNVNLLIYNGKDDLVCPYTGAKAISEAIPWSGHDEFHNQHLSEWNPKLNGKYLGNAGEYKTFKNLALYLVSDSGHQVPAAQPAAFLSMMQEAVFNWNKDVSN